MFRDFQPQSLPYPNPDQWFTMKPLKPTYKRPQNVTLVFNLLKSFFRRGPGPVLPVRLLLTLDARGAARRQRRLARQGAHRTHLRTGRI